MKAISENLYRRGKKGTLYCRVRIPRDVLAAYPPRREHLVKTLETSDVDEGKKRLRTQLDLFDSEFEGHRQRGKLKRAEFCSKRITSLTDEQLADFAKHWVHQVLLTDETQRTRGLDDDEYDAIGTNLKEQREVLGRMLAQGRSERILPAMHSYLGLCGLDVEFSTEQAKIAGYKFLTAIVTALDLQRARHEGSPIASASVAPLTSLAQSIATVVASNLPDLPQTPKVPEGKTWKEIFEAWRDYVAKRPKPTTIASQTAWRDLERFAKSVGVLYPGDMTPEQMTGFVDSMATRGLAVDTLNERLSKVKAVYRIAVGRHKLASNPAQATLGMGKSSVERRVVKRLAFDEGDVQNIFGSPIFTEQLRSKGQSGEASYWIPLVMYYSGARTEEVGGLAVADIREEPGHGWYMDLIDRPEPADAGLFGAPTGKEAPVRTLKNGQSIRRVPIVNELIHLGLLRYVDWIRGQGCQALFPTLTPDTHGKLTGAFSKFFGRYKKLIGIDDHRKVLYSFRHSMKDTMERAEFPSKYLQRAMGHASGDGTVTDGYGSELPFEVLVRHFGRLKFARIRALPWEPGRGHVCLSVSKLDGASATIAASRRKVA